MIRRFLPFWILVALVFWAGFFACTAAFGQQAVITGPATGAAGWPVVFDSSGSSGSSFEWAVIPATASRGLVPVEDGRRLVFSVPYNGEYALILLVDRDAVAVHNLTITDGPPPDDPPPLPPPVDLSEYTRRLTDDVEAKGREFDEVGDIFFALAGRINGGELSGSEQILPATAEALFGPEGKSRQNWATWHTAVMTHLRDDLNFGLDEQWADAFKVIGEAVKR